jgi:nicotinate phosphoribosyltransferase
VYQKDVIARAQENSSGEPLLAPVMRAGRLTGALPSLTESRARCLDQLSHLPATLRRLAPAEVPYPVDISAQLDSDAQRLAAQRPH